LYALPNNSFHRGRRMARRHLRPRVVPRLVPRAPAV